MSRDIKDWLDIVAKLLAGLGFILAAITYRSQQRIKRAEWLKSLFEKFFETPGYKEARVWLDYGKLHDKLNPGNDDERIENEEKFTDFLNFFEFIGVLYSRNQLTSRQVNDVFDYYLKKIKDDPDCQDWITKYGFEKTKILLKKLR